jgi:uroporphyrinogen decarboxylase
MIGGSSRNGFNEAKIWATQKPAALEKLIAILIDASDNYLSAQIESGAEVIQLFDSWAGLLQGKDFKRWIIGPTHTLVAKLKVKYPHIPIIGFPREAGAEYRNYILNTGVDAISIDQHVDLTYAKDQLQKVRPLQGNLDPALVVEGGENMKTGIRKILSTLGPSHIFNLGHGVVPETPLENVAELVRAVREFRA